MAVARPSTSTAPLSGRSMPASARASSLRPEPSSPAMPTTSFSRTSMSTPRSRGARLRPRPASMTRVPVSGSGGRRTSALISRPSILPTRSMRSNSDGRYSPTSAPPRSTVMRSLIS
jgi:hypothetical protein